MNDPTVLQPIVAKVAALIDELAPLDELERAWAVLLRLWNAVDCSTPNPRPPASREPREANPAAATAPPAASRNAA